MSLTTRDLHLYLQENVSLLPYFEKKVKPVNDLLHQIFGRLTVLERAPNPNTRKNDTAAYWRCQCLCGTIAVIRGYSLTSGKTQSCGCLKLEAPHLTQFQQAKYSADISAARKVWKRRNRYSELPFDDFYRLSQQNCFYCDSLPSLAVYAEVKSKNSSTPFIYNTLDRVDSSLSHSLSNVVPACLICNRAKLDRTLEQFRQYTIDLKNNLGRVAPDQYREASSLISLEPLYDQDKYSRLTSVKSTKSIYQEGNLSLEQFYQLSQMNCYYCCATPGNKRNACGKYSSAYAKEHGDFIYNGLDRVDNSLSHAYDNVVPCCKYCNSAKNTLTLSQFDNWIKSLSAELR